MGDIFAFTSEINIVSGGRSNTSVNKRFSSSPGGVLRKTLADVTNIQPRPKPSQHNKPELSPNFPKEMDRLTKENEALKKENLVLKMQIAERNKITELSATELQNLRLNLQSLYQQNLQLAQANSQMLTELTSGKDRLKALHHELGCIKGVLSAKTLALQDAKKAADCRKNCNKVPTTKSVAEGEALRAENTSIKQISTNTRRLSKGQSAGIDANEKEKSENKRPYVRRQSSRFISEEPASTDDLLKLDDVKSAANAITDKEKSENKRPCVRRQSSRFKSEEAESTDDLLKVDDVKSAANAITDKEKSENKRLCVRRQSSRYFKPEEPASTEDLFELDDIKLPMQSQGDETKSVLSDNGKDAADWNSIGSMSTEGRRSSFGRPSRRAAEKVQSYREVPLNVKMRRSN